MPTKHEYDVAGLLRRIARHVEEHGAPNTIQCSEVSYAFTDRMRVGRLLSNEVNVAAMNAAAASKGWPFRIGGYSSGTIRIVEAPSRTCPTCGVELVQIAKPVEGREEDYPDVQQTAYACLKHGEP